MDQMAFEETTSLWGLLPNAFQLAFYVLFDK